MDALVEVPEGLDETDYLYDLSFAEDLKQFLLDKKLGPFLLKTGCIRLIDAAQLILFTLGESAFDGLNAIQMKSKIKAHVSEILNSSTHSISSSEAPLVSSEPNAFDLRLLPDVLQHFLGVVISRADLEHVLSFVVPSGVMGVGVGAGAVVAGADPAELQLHPCLHYLPELQKV